MPDSYHVKKTKTKARSLVHQPSGTTVPNSERTRRVVCISLPSDVLARLDDVAGERKLTRSAMVEMMVMTL